LIAGLKAAEIDIDRKVLAQLAIDDPQGFSAIVTRASEASTSTEQA